VAGKRVGKVTHFFDNISVAVLALTGTIRVGDSLHFLGHGTDFMQTVGSMEIEHKSVESAKPGDDVALKVEQRVRPNDAVFRAEGE
jgi:translation elongation factor EF-1alpha